MRMLHNIKEHIFYMISSLKFVKTRLMTGPGILRSGKKGMDGRELFRQLGICGSVSGTAKNELFSTKQYFNDDVSFSNKPVIYNSQRVKFTLFANTTINFMILAGWAHLFGTWRSPNHIRTYTQVPEYSNYLYLDRYCLFHG